MQTKVGRMIAAGLILVGAILLIVSLVTPWYTVQTSGRGISETINFYPGMPSSNGTVQYSCSGGIPCPSQTSYSSLPANNTGTLAEAGFYILIVGAVLGIIAGVLGIASGRRPRWGMPVVALATVALILAVVAPGLYAVSLPSAVAKDTPGHSGNGPWSSFMGTNSTTRDTITLTQTWGPATGWYLAIAGFAVFLVGIVLFLRWRTDKIEATSAPSPAAATATSSPQTTPPPTNP